MANRILITLVALTLMIQIAILYRQRSGSIPSRPAKEQIWDAETGSVLDLTDIPLAGNPNASLVLVEFSDFECPYCQRHANIAGKELDRQFVTTGKLQHAFMNNPLPSHPSARLLATAAICSIPESHFWDMYELLFERKPNALDDVIQLAIPLGMDRAAPKVCLLDNQEAAKRIDRDIQIAQKFGLAGTPAFALGRKDSNNRMSVSKFVMGAQSFAVFEGLVTDMLSHSRQEE